MIWTKRTIKINVWEGEGGWKITEDLVGEDKPSRLQSALSDDEWFPSLEAAKAVAVLQNKLAVTEEENRRLKAQLGEQAGIWPTEEEASPEPTDRYGEIIDEQEDDGRGIPAGPGAASTTHRVTMGILLQ